MASEFEPVPIADLPLGGVEPPRRRPGRPPARNADGTRKYPLRGSTPRKGGSRARRPGTTPRPPATLYPELVGFLTMVNMGIAFTPLGTRHEATGGVTTIDFGNGLKMPVPETKVVKLGDEFDDVEIAVLAQAIDAQCRRSPRVKKYVQGFLGVTAGAGLAGVVGMIVARRLSRHGVIDPSLDAKIGAMLNGDISALASFTPPEEAPAPDPDAEQAPDRAATFDFATAS